MSILINKDTKIITQGITGKTGQFHTEKCQEYANGKNCFVAGVNPKKAGESIFGIPIYGSVKEAAAQTGATVSVIFMKRTPGNQAAATAATIFFAASVKPSALVIARPLVVRMKGTNEELGKKMLAESGLPIIAADTMAEAATKIVAAVK